MALRGGLNDDAVEAQSARDNIVIAMPLGLNGNAILSFQMGENVLIRVTSCSSVSCVITRILAVFCEKTFLFSNKRYRNSLLSCYFRCLSV